MSAGTLRSSFARGRRRRRSRDAGPRPSSRIYSESQSRTKEILILIEVEHSGLRTNSHASAFRRCRSSSCTRGRSTSHWQGCTSRGTSTIGKLPPHVLLLPVVLTGLHPSAGSAGHSGRGAASGLLGPVSPGPGVRVVKGIGGPCLLGQTLHLLERTFEAQEQEATMVAHAIETTEEDHQALDTILDLVVSFILPTVQPLAPTLPGPWQLSTA